MLFHLPRPPSLPPGVPFQVSFLPSLRLTGQGEPRLRSCCAVSSVNSHLHGNPQVSTLTLLSTAPEPDPHTPGASALLGASPGNGSAGISPRHLVAGWGRGAPCTPGCGFQKAAAGPPSVHSPTRRSEGRVLTAATGRRAQPLGGGHQMASPRHTVVASVVLRRRSLDSNHTPGQPCAPPRGTRTRADLTKRPRRSVLLTALSFSPSDVSLRGPTSFPASPCWFTEEVLIPLWR